MSDLANAKIVITGAAACVKNFDGNFYKSNLQGMDALPTYKGCVNL